MGSRVQVIISLSTALLLVVLFVVLLVRQSRHYLDPAEEPTGLQSAHSSLADANVAKVSAGELPFGSPTDPEPYKKPETKDYGGDLYRWNLGDLPEGWDREVARRIHDLFQAMEFEDLSSPDITQRVEQARKELEEYLASLGPEALPTLDKILNVEHDFVYRKFIYRGIGNLGPESDLATWILRKYYMSRYEDPRNGSEVLNLIQAMRNLKNETSFEMLSQQILEEDPGHRKYRDKFIMALGEHPRREEAVDIFSQGMDDRSFYVRNKSAQAFGKVRSVETLDLLYGAFEKERIWYVKQTILGSIGKIGEIDAIPFLEEKAREAPESGVRLSAANAIRRIVEKTGDRYGLKVLRQLLRTEPEVKVRQRIREWYGRL